MSLPYINVSQGSQGKILIKNEKEIVKMRWGKIENKKRTSRFYFATLPS